MAKPLVEEFLQPGSTPRGMNSVIGHIYHKENIQAVAASLAASPLWIAKFDGEIVDAFIQMTAVVGAGESCTFQILKNGVSIFTGGTAKTVDATNGTAKAQINLMDIIPKANRFFVKGDLFTVTRVYTAGGTPTPFAHNEVSVEFSIGERSVA